MEVREIVTERELNNFVMRANGGQFLQSWEWGEFQQEQRNRVWRLGVYQAGELLAATTVIERRLPLSRSYLYTPYGPVFRAALSDGQKEEIIQLILGKGREISIATHTRSEIFFRIEPRITKDDLGNFFFNLGLKSVPAVQPRDTQVVDLTRSEEDILEQMHQKTRYNIRLADKRGVTVRIGKTDEDLQKFLMMMKLTTDRDNFHSHPLEYYEKLFAKFRNTDISDQSKLTIVLLFAEKNGVPLAAGLFSFFGDRVIYLHGASANQMRDLMAPYAVQWEAIKLGKKYQYGLFDLYGVAPKNRKLKSSDKEIKWGGISRFKRGFGGHEVNYTGAWDWVYDKMWYAIYNLGKRVL